MFTFQNPDPNARARFILWRPFIALWHWLFPPSVAHSDRQSRTARYLAAGVLVSIALGLIVVVGFNARSWHHAWKQWRSNVMVHDAVKAEKEADQYLEASRQSEYKDAVVQAFKKAGDAYQKDPSNPEAIRVMARLYTRAGRNEARFLWKQLENLGKLTDDDVTWLIQSLSHLGEDKNAVEQIEDILRRRTPTKRIAETADVVLQNLKRTAELLEVLKRYSAANPDDLDAKLLLRMRLVQFGTADEQRAGMKGLWEITASDSAAGLHALEFLNKVNLGNDDQRRLIERLQKHPLVQENHRILALQRLAGLEPEHREKILQDAIEAHRKSKPEDLLPLVSWLVQDREADKILSLLTEETAKENHILLPSYLNALTLAARYDDLERIVRDPRTRLTTAEKDYHLVHLAFVRNVLGDGGAEKIDDLLSTAVQSALKENRSDMLLKLGEYAEKRKRFKTAVEAYQTAARSSHMERPAYEGLLRSSYLSGNTKDFLETSRETVRRWPDNKFFLERFLYASLLNGTELEASGEQARALLKAMPNDSQRKLLMALYSQRTGDSDACRTYLQNSNLDDLTPGQRAVFCGLTRFAGFTGQAAELAKTVPLDQPILPEELRYLNQARGSATAAVRF